MRPLSLKMRGFTTYADPIDLDLSAIPPGLVAITGENGAGKSSLMECLGTAPLFLEFSGRKRKLYDLCNGRRDAYLDFACAYRGRTYRMLVQADAGTGTGAGSNEAYLFEDEAPLTPGKGLVGDFADKIGAIFPSKEVFLASAFGSQGRAGNFFDLAKDKRKELFAELLGLGHMETLSQRAGAARRPLDAVAAKLADEATRIEARKVSHLELRAEIDRLVAVHRDAVVVEQASAAALREAEAVEAREGALVTQLDHARTAALAEKSRYEVAILSREGDERDAIIAVRNAESTSADEARVRERANALAAACATLTNAQADHATAKRTADSAAAVVRDIETSLTTAREDLRRAEQRKVRSATARTRLAELQPRLDQLARALTTLAALETGAAKHADAGPRSRAASGALVTARATLAQAELRRDAAARQEALLYGVPCGGATLYEAVNVTAHDCSTCQFLGDARAAQTSLPTLEQAVLDATDAVSRAEAEARTADVALVALDTALARLGHARADAARLAPVEVDAAAAKAEIGSDELAEIAVQDAAARVTDLEARRATAETERASAGAALAEAAGAARRADATAHDLAGANDALRRVEAALARLPLLRERVAALGAQLLEAHNLLAAVVVPPVPEEQRARHQAARAGALLAREAWTPSSLAAGDAGTAVAHARGRLAQLGDPEVESIALEAKLARVALRRMGFVLVEQAMGQDGIQALEIDAAGPQVSTLANDLLQACFGAKFTVALRTVAEAERGRKQQEVFDVVVFNGESGARLTYEDLSGGEKVLVSEAIRLSLAIFNAQRSGHPFETLYRDEADTGLSEKYRPLFPAMLRRALALGGFRNLYFITHAREAWEQADTIIRVENGMVTIE